MSLALICCFRRHRSGQHRVGSNVIAFQNYPRQSGKVLSRRSFHRFRRFAPPIDGGQLPGQIANKGVLGRTVWTVFSDEISKMLLEALPIQDRQPI
jgi:hypothetical protein